MSCMIKGLIVYGLQFVTCKNQAFDLRFLYFYNIQMDAKKLELKSVYELSPEELQELDLQEGDELVLFEGDPDYMVIP